MDEVSKPAVPPMPAGLLYQERAALLAVRQLLARKPEAVLRYLAGGDTPTRALVALALSAQLEISKQHLATMHVTNELCRFLKVGESNTNDVEENHGQDATPGS